MIYITSVYKNKSLIIFFILFMLFSCKKEENKSVEVQYELETSQLTGDHFYVNYTNEIKDTIVEHQHPGWKYTFRAEKPYNAYIRTEVNPIDSYDLSVKILIDKKVVQQQSISTASGGIKTITLSYNAE